MHVDLLVDPFGARWTDVRAAALVAEQTGFDGLWTWDHLAGQAHGTDGVLECWTLLTALATVVPRVMIGPMVLNVANRRPAVVATMAATLQQVSGGRLLLGLGAGGGRSVPYPAEQDATGVPVPADPVRRRQVREAVHVLRQLWTGRAEPFEGEHFRLGEAEGFLRPDPPPPIILGAFGPKMASLAGECADGLNTHASHPRLEEILEVARKARARAGAGPDGLLVTVSAPLSPTWAEGAGRDRLLALGVDRVILLARPPFDLEAIAACGRGATGRFPSR